MASKIKKHLKKGNAHLISYYFRRKRFYVYVPATYPDRDLKKLLGRLKELIDCKKCFREIPTDVIEYFDQLGPKIRAGVEKSGLLGKPVPRTLGALAEAYVASRENINLSNSARKVTKYGLSALLSFFDENTELDSISQSDIEMWKQKMMGEKSEATTARYLGVAGEMWFWGKECGYVKSSPVRGVKRGSMATKKIRYVTLKEYDALLKVCPNQSWRTLLALARIGGLRNPIETSKVMWEDICWDEKRPTLLIHSTKTARYGKPTRTIPLWGLLRKELAKLKEEKGATTGAVLGDINLETADRKLKRLMVKAELDPWKRPFHNLRGSRSKEVFSKYPEHVAEEWMGHTKTVAKMHYLQATDEQIRSAAKDDL